MLLTASRSAAIFYRIRGPHLANSTTPSRWHTWTPGLAEQSTSLKLYFNKEFLRGQHLSFYTWSFHWEKVVPIHPQKEVKVINTFDPFFNPSHLHLPRLISHQQVSQERRESTLCVLASQTCLCPSSWRGGFSYLSPCDTQNPFVAGLPALCFVSSSFSA